VLRAFDLADRAAVGVEDFPGGDLDAEAGGRNAQ
jgi:hypothetical protein